MSCPETGGADTLPHDIDPLAAEAFRAFKRVMHLSRQYMMRVANEAGGHPAQIGCLMTLMRHENSTQRELAEHLQIAPATLTPMLQRMEKAGSIERYVDANDQRVTRVRLTDAGREQSATHAKAHAAYMQAGVGNLSKTDQTEFIRLLTLIGDNIAKELDQ